MPCGPGNPAARPDLKWRHPDSVAEFVALQQRILAEAATCVAGGVWCMHVFMLPEENQQQVEAFLQENPQFELLDAAAIAAERCPGLVGRPVLQLRPDRHGTDGFFAAVLQRRKEGCNTASSIAVSHL